MNGVYLKTEHHYSKGKRTQIIHTQVDTQEMQAYPPFKTIIDPITHQPIGREPNIWEKPIIKKRVIHHNL